MATDWSFMTGQLDPASVRTMAPNWRGEAAVEETIVMIIMTREFDLEPELVASPQTMSQERRRQDADPDAVRLT